MPKIFSFDESLRDLGKNVNREIKREMEKSILQKEPLFVFGQNPNTSNINFGVRLDGKTYSLKVSSLEELKQAFGAIVNAYIDNNALPGVSWVPYLQETLPKLEDRFKSYQVIIGEPGFKAPPEMAISYIYGSDKQLLRSDRIELHSGNRPEFPDNLPTNEIEAKSIDAEYLKSPQHEEFRRK